MDQPVSAGQSVWQSLPKPFIGLAPMDGVTDAVCRQITKQIGNPDLLITEFVAVEGIARNAVALLSHLTYQPTERPIIGQVYGIEPASFRKTAVIVAALGFDGIDINMGCPAKKVSRRGAGAGLINNQTLAAQIIEATKQGVTDWCNGQNITDLDLKPKMVAAIVEQQRLAGVPLDLPVNKRRAIPVSVKTRVGYDSVVIDEWAHFLASQELAAISIHGRTLKQMYTGRADWEAIAKGAAIIKQESPKTLVIGNGDLATRVEALAKIKEYRLDGALIGRAAIGNPWVFTDHVASVDEKLSLAVSHARLHEETYGSKGFSAIRRFLAAYSKEAPHAAQMRMELMQAPDADTVAFIIDKMNGIVE